MTAIRAWVMELLLVAGLSVALPGATLYAADPAAGAKVSRAHCAKCHGEDGRGQGTGLKQLQVDVQPVPWPDKVAMTRWKEEDLRRIIAEGGRAVGKSKVMPPYRGKLSETEVADVVAYIRSLAK